MKFHTPAEFKPLFFFLRGDGKPDYRYFDFSGGRSSAKSTTVAFALALEGSLHPIRVLCAREYQSSIKESVKALLEQLISDYHLPGYQSYQDTIENVNGTRIIFKGLHNDVEANVKSTEGIDRCWVEEAQTISEKSLDILLPTIREDNSTIIFTRNPQTIHDVITRRFVTEPTPLVAERTYHAHVTWRCMERAGILPNEIRQQVKEAEGTPEFAHIWEGKPEANLVNQIISWNQLDNATKQTPNTDGGTSFGVDVARYGSDRTAVAIVQGQHLAKLISWRHASITDSAQRIRTLASAYHPTAINVDDTGVGGGLTDLLKTFHLPTSGINYAAKPKQPNLYPNVASELWFDFADMLDTLTIDSGLPDRTELFTELTTREWAINNRNLRQVQQKAEYKTKQDTGSPDLADSVLLAYYKPLKLPTWNVSV